LYLYVLYVYYEIINNFENHLIDYIVNSKYISKKFIPAKGIQKARNWQGLR